MVSSLILPRCKHITLSEFRLDILSPFCSDTAGNYTNNSTYQKNLKTLFSSMVSNTKIDNGFYNMSVGQGADKVEAIVLCRSDVDASSCRGFINQSATDILTSYPNYKVEIGWIDELMLRYSDSSIFDVLDKENYSNMTSSYNVSEGTYDSFSKTLQVLLKDLQSKAAAGGSRWKSAAGNTSFDLHTILSLVQCTPDLTEKQCSDCLVEAAATIEDCCTGSDGAKILKGSCSLRYEMDKVLVRSSAYNSSSPPSSQTPSTTLSPKELGSKSTNSTIIIIIIVVSIIAALLLIVAIFIFLRRRRGRKTKEIIENDIEDFSKISRDESLHFDFNTIKAATESFSTANKLGQGGFGAVYKGRITNGQEIAVKRLSKNSAQGYQEFTNEVLLVAKLQHRNLVRLLEFSLAEKERLLIYEFLPDTSLDHFIFDKRLLLDWEKRYKIIGGIARGLLYLHEDSRLRIIHCDLKASNITLDGEMNSKISDFGMARLFAPDETQASTIRIVGTYGYIAPEYVIKGHFSVKSDVYSFGVLVLEILTGQKNSCFWNRENMDDLPTSAWKCWRNQRSMSIIDSTVRNGSMSEIMRCMCCVLARINMCWITTRSCGQLGVVVN